MLAYLTVLTLSHVVRRSAGDEPIREPRRVSYVSPVRGHETLLVPRTAALGAMAAMGLMVGAIGSHLTVLGIELRGDGGASFATALIVLATSFTEAIVRRREIPIVGAVFKTNWERIEVTGTA